RTPGLAVERARSSRIGELPPEAACLKGLQRVRLDRLERRVPAAAVRSDQRARIRLFFGSWVTSASPSASSSGGMYTPNRPRRPFFRPYQPPSGLSSDRPHASTVPSAAGFCSSAP